MRTPIPLLDVSDETLDDADADQTDAQDTGDQEQGRRQDHFTAGTSPVNAGLQNGGGVGQESSQGVGCSLGNYLLSKI